MKPDNCDKENKTKVQRLINLFWGVEAALIIAGIFQSHANWIISLVLTIAIISMVPVYFLAKKGKTVLGSNILLLLLTIILLGFVWAFNGLRDEVLLVFPAIIMISLLMGSKNFAIYIYILVSINILAIGYLNDVGIIHNTEIGSTLDAAILLTIILTFISYIAWLISIEMKKTNQELRKNQNELEKRVQQRTIELEESFDNLKNTQEQLIQTEKMASLGRLVAGVAHEINTPIGIAITASSYLEHTSKEFHQLVNNNNISKKMLANYIETTTTSSKLIQSNLNRAAELIQGFKEVAVDQSSDEIREFDLKEYFNEILASLHPKIKRSHCKVDVSCPENISVNTSPGAIAQIMTNLVINAIVHGFEGKDNGSITILVKVDNNHINLTFQDDGCGIHPNNLNNIFEPFFTTKRGKGGSGLGMHIVYNLVTQSLHGSIKCISTLGEGTSFMIRFPRNIPNA